MKNFLALLLIYLFFTSLLTKAQNLVPDSSFEKAHRLPTKKDNSLTCTTNWMSPTNGASDYYHKKGKSHAGVPRNIFGKQKPHSGDAYAGICVRTNFIE
jgi:OmpA-OmpF porin, OOP family